MHLNFDEHFFFFYKITAFSNTEIFQAMANTGFLVDWAIGRVRGRMIGVGWAGGQAQHRGIICVL